MVHMCESSMGAVPGRTAAGPKRRAFEHVLKAVKHCGLNTVSQICVFEVWSLVQQR